MKIRDLTYLLGRARPAPKTWGTEVETIRLPREPEFQFAHWLNPRVKRAVFTPGQIAQLREFLRPGDFVIDIGAHSGDTTVPYALAVGTTGLVLALEPNPHVFEVLKSNARLNANVGRIEPLMVAAAEADGPLTFEYSDADFTNGGLHKGIGTLKHGHVFKLDVTGVNLTALLRARYGDYLSKLRYIKIDAEGYDFYILKSLHELIGRYRPIVQVEVFRHVQQDIRLALYDLLAGLGYELHRVESLERLFGPPLARTEMLNGEHFDVMAAPGAAPDSTRNARAL